MIFGSYTVHFEPRVLEALMKATQWSNATSSLCWKTTVLCKWEEIHYTRCFLEGGGAGGTHVVDGTCPGNAPVQPARGWRAWGGRAQTQRPERAAHCRHDARGQVGGTWRHITHRSQSQTSTVVRMKKHDNKLIRTRGKFSEAMRKMLKGRKKMSWGKERENVKMMMSGSRWAQRKRVKEQKHRKPSKKRHSMYKIEASQRSDLWWSLSWANPSWTIDHLQVQREYLQAISLLPQSIKGKQTLHLESMMIFCSEAKYSRCAVVFISPITQLHFYDLNILRPITLHQLLASTHTTNLRSILTGVGALDQVRLPSDAAGCLG